MKMEFQDQQATQRKLMVQRSMDLVLELEAKRESPSFMTKKKVQSQPPTLTMILKKLLESQDLQPL